MSKKLTTSEFISKAKLVHGNKYDYSSVEYINCRTKVKIICPTHGVFEQKPQAHMYSKDGCPQCAQEVRNKSRQLSVNQFILKSNQNHNNEFDYSLVEYKNNYTKIKIRCCKHDVIFETHPNSHMSGVNGCPKCKYENKKITCADFIVRAKQTHGDLYGYKITKYENMKTKVDIICHKHGVFTQNPSDHIQGRGCPQCNKSNGELQIEKYLIENNIDYVYQKRFNDCVDTRPLPFDFYLPKQNICIEFDGIQHYESVDWFGGTSALDDTQKRDKIKNQYCLDNDIKLIRIPYDFDIKNNLNIMLTF